MDERRRIIVLMVVMALIVLSAVAMTSIILYRGTILREKERLRESVQSKVSLITAIIEDEEELRRNRTSTESDDTLSEHTLGILIRAHAKFEGFGETGEYVLGKREGDLIVFLLRHRHYDLDKPLPVPISSNLAEPMERALSGQSGTDILLDYRGQRVITAYEPLPQLGWGLVAKIDLEEVRARYIKTAALVGALSLALIAVGAFLFLRISEPIIAHLEESERKYRALSEDLEKEVRRKVAELQEAERMAAVGRMVSVVAHEVRNPLQHIRLGVDTLEMYTGQFKDKLEIVEEIQHGVTVLDEIISDLLEYSRPVSLKYSSTQSGALVKRSLGMLSHKLDNVSLHVELECEEREIAIDPVKMSQVLVNVISNSVEALDGGGNIWISTRFFERDGVEFLEFSISDDGPGMSEETLKQMEEPFFTTRIWGTGLGIPISRKIIDAHKGRLNVRSQPGHGTTVEITLPLLATGQNAKVLDPSQA